MSPSPCPPTTSWYESTKHQALTPFSVFLPSALTPFLSTSSSSSLHSPPRNEVGGGREWNGGGEMDLSLSSFLACGGDGGGGGGGGGGGVRHGCSPSLLFFQGPVACLLALPASASGSMPCADGVRNLTSFLCC